MNARRGAGRRPAWVVTPLHEFPADLSTVAAGLSTTIHARGPVSVQGPLSP